MRRVRKNLCRRLISGISAFAMALTMMTFALPQLVFAATTDDIGSIKVQINWEHTGLPATGEAHSLGKGDIAIDYYNIVDGVQKKITSRAATFGYEQSSISINLLSGYDDIKLSLYNNFLGYMGTFNKVDDKNYVLNMKYHSKQYVAKQSWIDTTSVTNVPETTFDIEMIAKNGWDEDDKERVKTMLSSFVVKKTVPTHNKSEETTVVWNLPTYYQGRNIEYEIVQSKLTDYYTKSPTVLLNQTSKERTDWDFVNINTKSTTDLPVKKIWLDEGYENKRPSSVTVGIYDSTNMTTPVKTIAMSNADATDAHTWQKNVTLPMINAQGELIEYRLKENELANYKTTYDASEKEGYYIDFDKFEMYKSGFGLNIVRTDEHGNKEIYSPNAFYVSDFFEGATEDDVGHGDTHFTGVLKLYNDMLYKGSQTYTASEWGRTGSHYTYDGKDTIETRHPYEQGDGSIYDYRLSENSDERIVFVMNTQSWGDYYGFKIKEISPIGNEDTIVNRYINVPIDIPFEKQWDDAGHEDKRPASIEFDLYRNGEKIKSKTVTASNNWKGSFSGEMKYDDNGKEYAYVVREGKAIAKDGNVYKTTYTKPDEPYFNALEIKFKDFRDSELTDTIIYPEMYFNDGNKWWQLNHHSQTSHYMDGLIVQIPATNFVLSASPNDSFMVQAEYIKPIHLGEELQSLYANFSTYSSTAPAPAGYHQCYYSTTPNDLPLMKHESAASPDDKGFFWKFELEDGYAVTEGEKTVATNKYETIDFPVNKYWNVKDVSTIPVSEVEFELVNAKNPDKVIRTLTVTNQNKQSAPSAYIDGEVWTGTFEGLPKYNSDGTLAVYQVREKSQIDGFTADAVNAPIVGTSPYAGAWITLETDSELSTIPYIYVNSAGGEVRYQDIVVSDMNKQKFFVPYNYGTNFDFRLYQLSTNADLKVTSYELTTEMPDRDKMNNIYFYSLNLQTPSEEYLAADNNIQYIVDGNKIYRSKKDISYSDKAYFNYLGEYNTEEEIRNKVGSSEKIYDLTVNNGLRKLHRSKYARDITYNSAYDYYLIDGKSVPTASKKFSFQPYGNEENNIGKLSVTNPNVPIHSIVNSPKKVELKVNKVWDYSKANKSNRNIGAVTFQVVNKKNPDVPLALKVNNVYQTNPSTKFALINPYIIDKLKAGISGTTFTKTPDDYVNVPWNSIYEFADTNSSVPVLYMLNGGNSIFTYCVGDTLLNLPYLNSDGTKAEYLIKELTVTYMDNAEVVDTIQKDLADTITETDTDVMVTKNISNTTTTETKLYLTKEWEIVKSAITTDNIGGAVFEVYNKKNLNTPITLTCVNNNTNTTRQSKSIMLINPYFVDKSLHSAENGQIVEYTKTPQDFADAVWNGQYVYYVPTANSEQEIKTFLTNINTTPATFNPYNPYAGYVPMIQNNPLVGDNLLVPSLNADGTRAEYVIKEKMLVDMQGNQIENNDFVLEVSPEQKDVQGDVETRYIALKNTDDKHGKILLLKDNNGKKLAGTQFGVYSNSDCTTLVETITTDAQGIARSGKLDYGTYYVKETKAINGYKIERTVYKATINSNGICYITKANNTSTDSFSENLTGVNAILNNPASIKVTKQFMGSIPFGSAEMVLKSSDADLSGVKTNAEFSRLVKNSFYFDLGDNGRTEDTITLSYLPDGHYSLEEIVAPDGYVVCDEVFYFEVKEGVVTYQGDEYTDSEAEIVINNSENFIEISKLDADDKHHIEGAVLALYDVWGNEIERWETNGRSKTFTGLKRGEYTLKELKAPKGYNTADDVKFTVSETTSNLSVKMYDRKGSYEMPETGGAGRTGVYVISLILLLAGTIYLVHTKKAEKE